MEYKRDSVVNQEKIYIETILVGQGELQIELKDVQFPEFIQAHFVIFQKKGKKRWQQKLDLEQLQRGFLEIDVINYLEQYFEGVSSTWTIELEAETLDTQYVYTFKSITKFPKNKNRILADKRNQFLNLLAEETIGDKKWFCQLYYSEYSTLSLRQREKSKLYTAQIESKLTNIAMRKDTIIVDATMDDIGIPVTGIILKNRGGESSNTSQLPFQCQITKEGKKYNIHGELKLKGAKLDYNKVDIFVLMEDESGDVYFIYIVNKDTSFIDCFHNLFHPIQYKVNNISMFYPYISVYKNLVFTYQPIRKGNSLWFRLKERIANKLYKYNMDKFDKENIMLIYEKDCEAAQENGFYFFQYCMEHNMEAHMKREIYFVINKKSPQYTNVKPYGKKVLHYLSIRHMMYLLATKLFVSSETKVHSYEKVINCSIIRPRLEGVPTVFLQHGVIALKKLPFLSKKNTNLNIHQFITSSELERDIVVKYLDYKKEEVAVTGLARWDLLEDKSEGSNELLLMPTWRNELELVTDEEFEESSYFKHYMQLLNDERLNTLLSTHKLTLNFYMHPKLRRFMNHFSSEQSNIRLIAFGEEELNELIMRTKLMITDYSSAVWDAYWLKKPVIFYQFDKEEYKATHGAYFDLGTQLFGDVVERQEDFLTKIEEMIESKFKEKEEYAALRERYLPYIDHENRMRICEAILKAGL